ncbi:hypothetical protein GQ42DRAFT_163135 [Ramicandelaber brevisporus]|nr:hypothetical protein GQ42DRAFT_163135 [Ramicandelaber brevisporus]
MTEHEISSSITSNLDTGQGNILLSESSDSSASNSVGFTRARIRQRVEGVAEDNESDDAVPPTPTSADVAAAAAAADTDNLVNQLMHPGEHFYRYYATNIDMMCDQRESERRLHDDLNSENHAWVLCLLLGVISATVAFWLGVYYPYIRTNVENKLEDIKN